MLKAIFTCSSLVMATAAGAQALPTAADVNTVIVAQACFKLNVEITRLSDLETFPATAIPLCVSMPALKAADCKLYAEGEGPTDQYTCDIVAADPAQTYVKVSTPGYDFSSYVGSLSPTPASGTIDPSGGMSFYLELGQSYRLQDAWNNRLTKILQQQTLPVAFSAVELPSMGETMLLYMAATRASATSPVATDSPFDPPAGQPRFFSDVQANGYDESGAEYGIHITSSFDHAVMAQPVTF